MDDPIAQFEAERERRRNEFSVDSVLLEHARRWVEQSMQRKYVYNFDWLGRPIIQYPEDMVAIQELIWRVRPDLVVETGIAHGGSLVLSASVLAMLDYSDAVALGTVLDPANPSRVTLGLDIDIRAHNRAAIEAHPLASRIEMIEGSSIDPAVIEQVRNRAAGKRSVMVLLDSNHTHAHVLGELNAYAGLVTTGSYCVVFDTFVEDMPRDFFPDRPWNPGNSPKSATVEFLKTHPEFEVDVSIDNKLLISVAPGGFLRRVT